jgi:flagellar biosynthesis/type III secretory pathway chaperone
MSAMASLLEALESDLTGLHDTVSLENRQLAAGQVEALPDLAHTKEIATARVAARWSALIGPIGAGEGTSRSQVEDALRSTGDASLVQSWHRTLELAEQVERLNRLNGKLIDDLMLRTQNALQILRSASRERGLYGSNGRVVELFSPRRTIDKV